MTDYAERKIGKAKHPSQSSDKIVFASLVSKSNDLRFKSFSLSLEETRVDEW